MLHVEISLYFKHAQLQNIVTHIKVLYINPIKTFRNFKRTLFNLKNRLVKGIVHPKLKIKSLITHHHAVPTP